MSYVIFCLMFFLGFLFTWLIPGSIISFIFLKEYNLLEKVGFGFGLSMLITPVIGILLTSLHLFSGTSLIISISIFSIVMVLLSFLLPHFLAFLKKRYAFFRQKKSEGKKIPNDPTKKINISFFEVLIILLIVVDLVLKSTSKFQDSILYLEIGIFLLIIANVFLYFSDLGDFKLGTKLRLKVKEDKNKKDQNDQECQEDRLSVKNFLLVLSIVYGIYLVLNIPVFYANSNFIGYGDPTFHVSRIQNILNGKLAWTSVSGIPNTIDSYPFFQQYMLASWFSITDIHPFGLYSLSTVLIMPFIFLSLFLVGHKIGGNITGYFTMLFSLFLEDGMVGDLLPIFRHVMPGYKITEIFLVAICVYCFLKYLDTYDKKYEYLLAVFISLLFFYTVYGVILIGIALFLYLLAKELKITDFLVICLISSLISLPYVYLLLLGTTSSSGLTFSFPTPDWQFVYDFPPFWIILIYLVWIPLLGYRFYTKKNHFLMTILFSGLAVILTMSSIFGILGMDFIYNSAINLLRPHKIFYSFHIVCFFLTCQYIALFFKETRIQKLKPIIGVLLIVAILSLTLSHYGTKTYDNYAYFEQKSYSGEEIYKWIHKNINHSESIIPGNEIVSSYAGNHVVLGRAPSFDTLDEIELFLTSKDIEKTEEIMRKYGAKYVLIGPSNERSMGLYFARGEFYLNQNGTIMFATVKAYCNYSNVGDIETKEINRFEVNVDKFKNPPFRVVYSGENGFIAELKEKKD